MKYVKYLIVGLCILVFPLSALADETDAFLKESNTTGGIWLKESDGVGQEIVKERDRVAESFTVCASGCDEASIGAFGGTLIPGDDISLENETLTENVNTRESGTVGNVINVHDGTISGYVIIDEDYWTFDHIIIE